MPLRTPCSRGTARWHQGCPWLLLIPWLTSWSKQASQRGKLGEDRHDGLGCPLPLEWTLSTPPLPPGGARVRQPVRHRPSPQTPRATSEGPQPRSPRTFVPTAWPTWEGRAVFTERSREDDTALGAWEGAGVALLCDCGAATCTPCPARGHADKRRRGVPH